jgi:hypothetical protein
MARAKETSSNDAAEGSGSRSVKRRSMVADNDRALHLAVLVAVMREEGFGAQSIGRVQQGAIQMLDALGRAGVAVPRPRIFDPKAPSARTRPAQAQPVREPTPTPTPTPTPDGPSLTR